MSIATQIGEHIKAAREKARLSRRELGRKTNISGTMIGGYEAGASVPTADKLARLADVLNLHSFEVNGYWFSITRIEHQPSATLPPSSEQLKFDFSATYTSSKASVKISPGRITVVFDAINIAAGQ